MLDTNILSARDLIDTEKYPIDDLDSPAGTRLLEQCHEALENKALCALHEFVRPRAVKLMNEEAVPLVKFAPYRNENGPFGYVSDRSQQWPDGHPKRTPIPNRYRQVLNHHIPNDSLIRKLYLWSPLTEFVRRVFGASTLYRSQCPHLSLTMKVAGEGDTDGWHYDPNDGVVSLLLQKPDQGGQFEYAPYLRTKSDERWDDVAHLFANPEKLAQRPRMEAGTFVFFNGNLSMHRVIPVGVTAKPRMIALLSYDQRPDQVFGQRYINHLRSFPADADEQRAGAPAVATASA